jgi:tRNA threonylcarbamoyladenosine biosynthesis protein TsaE
MASAERRFLSSGPEVTEAFGEQLGRALVAGSCLALVGELGAGKTTLVRGLGRGLECSAPVTSPTFTRLCTHAGRLPLYHFDAWRAGGEGLFEEGQELLGGEGVAVVEWADRVEAWLPRPRLELCLAHAGEGRRTLAARLVAAGEGAGPRARALEADLLRALDAAARTPGLA